MTLIAAGGFHTFPAIFGDVLIAGAGRWQAAVAPPLAGEPAESSGARVSSPNAGPNQKVVLLGHNCVIAWAGAATVAHGIIAEMRAMAAKAPLSMASIAAYLSQLDPMVKDQVSFVGWVKDAEVFHQFWHRADAAQSAMFGRISAGGSAATAFVTLAARVAATTWNVIGGAPEGIERAVSWMLSGSSLLYQAELSRGDDQSNYLDGGYEIATFFGDRFAKVGDISYVFWMADRIDDRVSLRAPELVLKHDYAGESLLLQVLRIRPGDTDTDPLVIGEAKHVIPPFGSTADAEETTGLSWPEMAATFTCHLVFVRTPTGFDVANRVEFSQSRSPNSIRLTQNGGEANLHVSREFCDELAQSITGEAIK